MVMLAQCNSLMNPDMTVEVLIVAQCSQGHVFDSFRWKIQFVKALKVPPRYRVCINCGSAAVLNGVVQVMCPNFTIHKALNCTSVQERSRYAPDCCILWNVSWIHIPLPQPITLDGIDFWRGGDDALDVL